MFKKIKEKRDERGFTLIELLIVVAIIAILAAIAIPQFAGYRARSVRASMIADARNVATSLEAYFTDGATYAPANGNSITGPDAFTLPDVLVGTRASKGNTVTITSDQLSYTISVGNLAGEAGGFVSPVLMYSDGRCEWSSNQSC